MVWILLAWAVAYFLRFHSSLPVSKGIPEWQVYFKLVPFIITIWWGVFTLLGVYGQGSEITVKRRCLAPLLQACVVATFAFIVVTYFYDEYKYSRATLLLFALLHPLGIIAGRVFLAALGKKRRKGMLPPKVLLIGSSRCFAEVSAVVRSSWSMPPAQIGAILVGDEEAQQESAEFCARHGITVHGVPGEWADFFHATSYARVIFALPYHGYQFIEENLAAIADQVLDIMLIPDLQRFTKFSSGVELIAGMPAIHIHESPLQGGGQMLKRLFDLLGALAALALFSPLMLLIAALVKCTSRGPILYRQERMGLDGREFSILKFRTMATTAESTTGAVWAVKNDQRTTGLGKFLRRTSLDELPQLVNVLKGEMSLVGPRPERPVFVASFRKEIPGYMLRHKVKAGITGWAQVNGWRGNTSIEKRIEYDLYYIQHWSLWLDIKILFHTVFKGFVNPNAY
jgi:Undecaprenyl-phosphate glucose phosphotransferase